MIKNYANCTYVVSTVTWYRSALVDLSKSRSVHAVEHDPCCPDPTKLSASDCKAVHYGLCSPLLKLPSFSFAPHQPTSNPPSPAASKGSSQPNSKASTPTKTSPSPPPLNSPKVSLEVFDPVELLADDLEGKLEALVSTFVAQDKVRVAARKKSENNQQSNTGNINLAKISALSPQPLSTQPSSKVVGHHTFPFSSGRVDKRIKDGRQTIAEEQPKKKIHEKQGSTSSTSDPRITSQLKVDGVIKKLNVRETPKQEVHSEILQSAKMSPFANKVAVSSEMIDETSRLPTEASAPTAVDKHIKVDPKDKGNSHIKASPEYQQTGVKAQITKFASREKEGSSSSPERKPVKQTQLNPQQQIKLTPQKKKEVPAITTKDMTMSSSSLVNKPQQDLIASTKSTKKTSNALSTNVDKTSVNKLSIKNPTSKPQVIMTSAPIQTVIYPLTTKSETISSNTIAFPKVQNMATSNIINKSPSPKTGEISDAIRPRSDQKLTKENRPSSYPSTLYKDLDITSLHQRSSSQLNLLNEPFHSKMALIHDGAVYSDNALTSKGVAAPKYNQEFILSPVDYAKTRFLNVHQIQKSEDVSKPRPKNGHLVSEAKFRWENVQSLNNSTVAHHLWPNHSPLGDQLVVDPESGHTEPLRDILQRAGHRRTFSMDGITDGQILGSALSIPHPKLTSVQKQHIRERSLSPTTDRHHAHVPIRPFLTKGSVAERVLLFECCPDRALERANTAVKAKPVAFNTWRTGNNDVQQKTQLLHAQRDKENVEPIPRTSSLRRPPKSSCRTVHIPRFYFPHGRPQPPSEIDNHLEKVASVFAGFNDGKVIREEFGIITKACSLPLYWKIPLFLAAGGDKKTFITCESFLDFWRRVISSSHDEASRFIRVITRGNRNYILQEDFIPLIQDVIDTHPGLTFLKEATEFHSRYVHTVIARIFYCVNRSWSGRIVLPELRKSNFLRVLSLLEEEEDINQITEYFSYEHFYVIYCKFWELDKDHDLFIDKIDLRRHNDGAISSRMIDRIFSGSVTRGPVQKEGKMSYTEFVWFLISEEDKRHPRSIEYWFRCMDYDGDGYLSMYELEYFYEEQLQRMEALGFETLPFKDCLCQMLDMIKPKIPGKISLSDLKKCKMTPIFFDTFFNLEKYLDHEQRDPFASQRQDNEDGPEMSDWDRYAAEEYELLVAEEGNSEQQDELMYDDYDHEEDELSRNLDKLPHRTVRNISGQDEDDDEYDYAETDADYHY